MTGRLSRARAPDDTGKRLSPTGCGDAGGQEAAVENPRRAAQRTTPGTPREAAAAARALRPPGPPLVSRDGEGAEWRAQSDHTGDAFLWKFGVSGELRTPRLRLGKAAGCGCGSGAGPPPPTPAGTLPNSCPRSQTERGDRARPSGRCCADENRRAPRPGPSCTRTLAGGRAAQGGAARTPPGPGSPGSTLKALSGSPWGRGPTVCTNDVIRPPKGWRRSGRDEAHRRSVRT